MTAPGSWLRSWDDNGPNAEALLLEDGMLDPILADLYAFCSQSEERWDLRSRIRFRLASHAPGCDCSAVVARGLKAVR